MKIGYNVVTMHFAGGVNNVAGMEMYINGRKVQKTSVLATNLSTDVVNPNNGIEIGVYGLAVTPPSALFFNGRMRKAQIINRVLTDAEHRRAFNLGTLEGWIPDSQFLLDIDFDRTSGPLVTRPGTPTCTFTAYGGRGYGLF